MIRSIITAFILVLVSGCAGQRPPEGGPVDLVPPEIISVYPAPNTTHFSGSEIALEFNEYVDRRSVEEAIFISPNIENIEFDWSGTDVTIKIREQLRNNTTYVITVGTDVSDVRNRNKMAKAFTLSFSTGEKIDNGMIAGTVYDERPQGIMIFSYRTDEIETDTLNPVQFKPDYITQTGNDGRFTLTNLAAGTYRLFAIKDEYRNLLYDPEIDAAGTSTDVTVSLTDSVQQGITFIIAKEDTTPPRIASVTAPDDRHVIVQFSEPMDSTAVRTDRFRITDTLGTPAMPIEGLFRPAVPANSYTLITAKQKPDSLYLLTVSDIRDKAGFVIHPQARQKQFKGSPVIDTIPPALVTSTVGGRASKLLPERPIEIVFSDALTPVFGDSAFRLQRKKDSTAITLSVTMTDKNSVSLMPKGKLVIDDVYILRLAWNDIKDIFGNRYIDSTTSIEFTIDDPERYGSIEGMFSGFGGSSRPMVHAKNTTDKNQKPVTTPVDEFGRFRLLMLPEGYYALNVFDDVNGNAVHDAGKVFPFLRAEKFVIHSDTIRVRARWPVDGVMIK
jgi:uncharacterized protein (DUF2141 family)